jgi:hypothetical protein
MPSYRGRIGHYGCLVAVEIQAADSVDEDSLADRLTVGHSAQIDTGSPVTLLASRLVELLRLPSLGMDVVETRYGDVDCAVYEVATDLVLGDSPDHSTERRRLAATMEVFEFDCLYDAYSLVLGRDAMSKVKITLDGPRRRFELSID